MQLPRVFIKSAGRLRRMGSLVVPRRRFLRGLASLAVCAPAVVRASNLMEVSAKFCGSSHMTLPSGSHSGGARPVAARNGAPIRRNAVRRRNSSAEVEESVVTRRPVIAEAKITALWELRTSFGPRGSPPKLLEDLPAEVRAGSFFDVWSRARRALGRGPRGSPARLRTKAVCAPFDNPSRSWNINRARSLDSTEGEKGTR